MSCVYPAYSLGSEMTKVTPASSTSATTSRASLRVGAITFSAKTCLPALAAAGMTSRWATVGVVTTTPSTSSRERSPSRSSWKGIPRLEASTCPRSLSSSQTAVISVPGCSLVSNLCFNCMSW